jgi:aspartyl-tRNA(Asn)/glutamyl-tRNA(Gln) amidotransferase subunit A
LALTLATALEALAAGTISSAALVERALSRIDNSAGEGSRAFISVDREAAHHAARADAVRTRGAAGRPLEGVAVSVKDLFDVAGQVTTAGSTALRAAQPAVRDATAVSRLRAAGAILIGRTNMTEFAFTGLGINPHYGTPLNPFDRKVGRIPGGSSSGAAVSVADGMCLGALATDTGGSVRIPAALCGLVGFKPTQRRAPLDGVYPLSPTLDSVGVIARTVADCALLDRVVCNDTRPPRPAPRLSDLRLAVPKNYVLDGLDDAVARAFATALSRLSAAGVAVREIDLPALSTIPEMSAHGTFAAIEAHRFHRELLASAREQYDPRVRARIEVGARFSESDYAGLRAARQNLMRSFAAAAQPSDALIFPTTPRVAPVISSLDNDDAYQRTNLLMLRNPTIVNLVDGCAITVPCQAPGELPCGLMVVGSTGRDLDIVSIAQAIERLMPERGGR